MKKIGLLTFQNAFNYGAFLQAYALQNTLSSQYKCEIVDYDNKLMKKSYELSLFCANPLKLVYRIFRSFVYFREYHDKRKRNKCFKLFKKKHFKLSAKYQKESLVKTNDYYDALIAGSDQVWNPESAFGWEYFLEFAEDKKKYSYAASFGGDIKDTDLYRMKNDLSSFQSLLVREQSGIDLIKSFDLAVCPQMVCDPVFLLSKKEWIEKLKLKERHKDYIFIYIVSEQTHCIEVAKKLAKKEKLKIICIQLYAGNKAYIDGIDSAMGAGPIEFLNLLLNAKYVFTTSFHGLAFSLIFNNEVYFELDKKKNNANSRLVSLSQIFGINDREITNEEIELKKIDWRIINNIISDYAKKSKDILFDSLKNV